MSKGSVLIVEDNMDTYELVNFILQKDGFDTFLAVNGRDGVDAAIKQKPDLIIMDLSMPEMDGWAATSLIKKNPTVKSTPVIVLTAHALPGEGWSARIMGGQPRGPTEAFLALVRQQVRARARGEDEGFGIETEMTLQALGKGFAVVETPIAYGTRPEGSFSKLNTYSDGAVVLTAIVMLFKDYRPLVFFGGLSLVLAVLAAAAGAAPVLDYLQHQWVYHVPLAILAAAIGILSAVSMSVGLILDTIARYHRENFAMFKRVLSERTTRDR